MEFCAFTPNIARIQREDNPNTMRVNIIRAINRNAWCNVTAVVLCVATSMANLVAQTKARSSKTSNMPTVVLSVICNECPRNSVIK